MTVGAVFPVQTAWSTILGARDPTTPEHRPCLERLGALYWKPVQSFLRRRWNLDAEDASDLTQEFFLKILDGGLLDRADPHRGRFRTFVKLRLRDLVVDDLRRRAAQKRGGDRRFVRIDERCAAESGSPEHAFDREWALCVVNEAIRRLQADRLGRGREVEFLAFRACVLDRPPSSYRECAGRLSIGEGDVRNFVFRCRAWLVDAVRDLVRDAVDDEPGAADECDYLMGLFQS